VSALLWIVGGLMLIFGWAGLGSGADLRANGDKSWKLHSLLALGLIILATLCWRAA